MGMNLMAAPDTREDVDLNQSVVPDRPWQTVVWNDPVNLMSYVVRVLEQYFGYPREVATRLMLSVHHDGHAVVAEGPREQMELHAQAMHDYGLWATIRKAPQ
ncbi:ATP-dependent Clp protease adapter ClpS [Microbacterium horticulturae]|uniref:ATP-dependent Clp protease adapter protein ClpS n=1 Tax=Microbacterium horticulturae TaxID=3028316 RepID=A0ABY8C1G6_9MICO|nr:ATP-dependent Clp protease adapter ClpS [Microbacterium sp. KACC 23027]WEG10283.1 ATP-dependent Clp protease adapter ClpS [Microbacterium sp. KACC 23027]